MSCSSPRQRLAHRYIGSPELLFRIPGALLSLMKFINQFFQASPHEASFLCEQSPLQRRLCLFE
jgi:hypothetical protein